MYIFDRYRDSYESELDVSHRTRGHGGIAIVWKEDLDPMVTKLDCGHDSCQAIVIDSGDERLCIVNVYMPVYKRL